MLAEKAICLAFHALGLLAFQEDEVHRKINVNSNANNNQRDKGVISFYPNIILAEEEHPTSAKFEVVETGIWK